MDKLTMAHEYFMKHGRSNSWMSYDVKEAWKYADAMQAEADGRVNKQRPDVLQEWQPDWSVAPEWTKWWAMDGFSEKANWYIDKPYLDDDSRVELEWNIDLRANAKTHIQAPSFGYIGNWQDSLRKRP